MNNCNLIARNTHINHQYASKTAVGHVIQRVSYREMIFIHSKQKSNGLKFISETNYRYFNLLIAIATYTTCSILYNYEWRPFERSPKSHIYCNYLYQIY